jgi:uncharacterized protein (TIGR00255 family)
MTQSMTGFSSQTIVLYQEHDTDHKEPIHMTITLKTLNSRFFESHFKVPHALSFLEADFLKHLKKLLYRGSAYLSIYMSHAQALNSTIKPALSTISEYMHALTTIKDKFNIEGSPSLDHIIKLPHVFDIQEHPLDTQIKHDIIQAVHSLVDDVIQTRKDEGQVLVDDLKKRIDQIKKHIKDLKPRAEVIIAQKKDQLFEHIAYIKENLHEHTESSPSLASLAGQLDKIDIHEEITRFESHIDSFMNCLRSEKVEKGKRLDFILQELFREINTISAKCSDSEMSSLAINIKVELEKAREQTQNLV